MVAGLQPNWRHIFLAFVLMVVFWYVFFSNDKKVLVNVEPEKVPVKKIQVEVYYEVWCPDSRRFVLDQVIPAWRSLTPIIDVSWKPYGKASHTKKESEISGYEFQCQHGPPECLGNTIHACAIKYVRDPSILNELIGCMMDNNRDVKVNAKQCIESHKVEWQPIEACSESKEGGELLAMHGDDTHSLKPGVRFIPTVQLNGSQEQQSLMLKNLPLAICKVYKKLFDTPSHCDKIV